MEIDLTLKQQLTELLAKPAMVTQEHTAMLNELVKDFPYYQPLHLLLAKANATGNHTATAALYNGGNLLFKILNAPETFNTKEVNWAEEIDQLPITATDVTSAGFQEADERNEENNTIHSDEQETFDEIGDFLAVHKKHEIAEEGTFDDEIYDEIGEIQAVSFDHPQIDDQETAGNLISPDHGDHPIINDAENSVTAADASAQAEISADELALENIVATDFFAFEKNFTAEAPVKPSAIPQPEEYDQEAEAQTVSKYNDDKLPYTFLWWLAKTRKEHEQIFQPYVTPKTTTVQSPGALQQQYVEHIFHLQTPFNDEETLSAKAVSHKSDEIIENFIRNEPQIRTPKADQLNNENKAKKSAEDHNDLVSETLAAIYIEQMLYHKAIETYEKLSLKFPEKSRYFADLIQSLEKKI